MAFANFALLSVALATTAMAPPATDSPRDAQATAAFIVYTKESLANGEQGTVRYHVKIDARGRATDCEIVESSGFERLDLATCTMLMDRAQFTPAHDERGHGTRSTYDGKVVWRIG